MSDVFDTINSYEGGIGFDPHFMLILEMQGIINQELFISEGYDSEIYIEN
jgi:hypothetical protein